MGERINTQKNSSAMTSKAQQVSTPLFQTRPFDNETSSTQTEVAQTKTSSFNFNFLNIPTQAPSVRGEIQKKEETEEPVAENDIGLQMQSGDGTIPQEQPSELEGDIQTKSISGDRESKQEQENTPIQTKLTVGKPGDQYEQEADNTAQQVMAMSDSAIQRTESEQTEEIQTKPLANNITPLVQRQTESEEIQTKPGLQRATDGNLQASSSIETSLSSSKGGGSPLPAEVRSFMEPRFGSDFSSVRMHTDSTAVQMNKELGAQAFTHGNNIYYGAGKSPGRDELTAHELTHTIQQTGGMRLKPQTEGKSLQPKKISANNSNSIQNKLTTGIKPLVQTKPDPGQILEQLKNTPPTNAFTAYDQAKTNSTVAWSAKKQELEQSIPKIPAPTGLPAQKSGSKQTPTTEKAVSNKETGFAAGNKEKAIAPAKTPNTSIVKDAPPPRPITPTRLAGGNTKGTEPGKSDTKVAASAQNALNNVSLDTSQISTKAGNPPKVDLTGAADPGQIDLEQSESAKQVQQAKAQSAKDINKDYGENNIFPEPSNEILQAKKQLTINQVPADKGGKAPVVPGEIAGNLNQSLSPVLKERISPEQQKYVAGKQKFDFDTAKARTDADKEIAKQNKETTQKQLQEQKLAKSEVTTAKQEWQTELNAAEKQFQDKASKASADQKKKINVEKQKGDAEAAKHIAEAERKAEQEKQKADNEAKEKKEGAKKESGGFLGWLADKASALIDGLKKAVNFIYDNLRKAVKFIFEQAKKLALAAIELAQKAIATLIKGFGEILKALVKVAFAAFPEIAKRINSKIDKAINKAVKAVNTAADLLKKGVAAVLDFLANTLDSLLKLIQDIYNGIFTVIGMIIRGEFAQLIKHLANLVDAAKAAPPQFETAGYEELLGGNFDEPLSPMELAQAGISPGGAIANSGGQSGTEELPKAPWSEANIGVDAVENNMELSPELSAELMQKTNGEGEVELASSNDASRTMDAVMSEVTGGFEGEGKEQKNPDDGLSPRQRAEIRWKLMKQGISQWWSNNWPKVLLGATAAIGGFIALNVVTGGAVTAALPAIMSVVGPLFAGVTIAQIGGHVRDYLAKGWEGDIQGGGKSLAKGLAAGAIELVSYLTFKAGDAALKGAKALAKGGVKLAKGAINLIAKGAKFIIEKGKVLFKGVAGTAIGKGFQRLRQLGEGLLERIRFKKFKITLQGRWFQIWGEINPWILLADGTIEQVTFEGQGGAKIGEKVKFKGKDAIVVGIKDTKPSKAVEELLEKVNDPAKIKENKALYQKIKKMNEDEIKTLLENRETTYQLRKGIEGEQPPDFQAHHIVPRELRGNKKIKSFLDDVGFDFEDGSRNGIMLPNQTGHNVAGWENATIHRGSHPTYTDNVRASLEALADAYNLEKKGLSGANLSLLSQQYSREIDRVIGKLKQNLMSGNPVHLK